MHDYPITRYIGFAILILAALEIFNITIFTPLYLFGFSISAFLLTLLDLLEFKADQKDDPFKYRRIKRVVLFFAIIFFMVVPNLSIELSSYYLEKINNIFVLLSIGLLFVILGFKQEKVINDKLLNIIDKTIKDNMGIEVEKLVQDEAKKVLEQSNLKQEVIKVIEEIEKDSIR